MYDDVTLCQGTKFALPDCYNVVRTLGVGHYGVVCHAVDSRLPDNVEAKQVAIKRDLVQCQKRPNTVSKET